MRFPCLSSALRTTTRCTPALDLGRPRHAGLYLRKKDCKQADHRQKRAYVIDELDAGAVCYYAEHGGAYAAHSESEAEEQARNHADAAWHQLLGIDQDRRECRREHEANYDAENNCRRQADVGQRQCKRQDAEDRTPDDRLAAESVPNRAANDCSGRCRGQGRRTDRLAPSELADRSVASGRKCSSW